jgi:hypothetical protein
MSFENTTFKDYFFLKDRDALSLDPWTDGKEFFGRQDLGSRIQKRIESDFVKPRGIPKFFVHGSYGSGKTHALAHIKYELDRALCFLPSPSTLI